MKLLNKAFCKPCMSTFDNKVNAAIAEYDRVNDGVMVGYSQATIAQYNKEGPKSEVYLDNGQQVAINITSGKYYYIGLRSLKGDEVTVQINGTTKKLSHTTDLYYEATPASGSIITIKNTSGGILAITKLRTTGAGNTTNGAKLVSTEETLAYVRSLDAKLAANSAPNYSGDTLTEEEAAVEEAAVTEEVLDESDITIENPEPEVTETEVAETSNSKNSFLSTLMSSFSRFFRR